MKFSEWFKKKCERKSKCQRGSCGKSACQDNGAPAEAGDAADVLLFNAMLPDDTVSYGDSDAGSGDSSCGGGGGD